MIPVLIVLAIIIYFNYGKQGETIDVAEEETVEETEEPVVVREEIPEPEEERPLCEEYLSSQEFHCREGRETPCFYFEDGFAKTSCQACIDETLYWMVYRNDRWEMGKCDPNYPTISVAKPEPPKEPFDVDVALSREEVLQKMIDISQELMIKTLEKRIITMEGYLESPDISEEQKERIRIKLMDIKVEKALLE